MNVIRKMSPHAAILIANMYYVFFGIDRVNTAMNFINNGYTKFLLVALCVFGTFVLVQLLGDHERRRGDGRELLRLIPMALNALLCLAVLIILLVDVILGDRGMPFLTEPVKYVTLLMCIAAWVSGFRLIAVQRAAIRAEQARRAAARRRPAPRPQPAPRSSRYDRDGYARSRYGDNGYSTRQNRYDRDDYAPARSRYEDDRYSTRSNRYAQDGYSSDRSRYSEDGSSARSNRYAQDDYASSRSRYAQDEHSSSRSRYSDDGSSTRRNRYEGDDYGASRSRYGESPSHSGYAGADGIRRGNPPARSRSASRYAEDDRYSHGNYR